MQIILNLILDLNNQINLVKTVAKLSDFTVEKEFKATQNVVVINHVVFFDFINGQTASWK